MTLWRRRPVLTICTLLGVAALVMLGTWQVQRLAWKTELIGIVMERTASAPVGLDDAISNADALLEYQPVVFRGMFLPDRVAQVFGTYEGVPGTYVYQLFRLTDGEVADNLRTVLVNRGFVSREGEAADGPYATAPGEIEISGLLRLARKNQGISKMFAAPANLEKGYFYSRDIGPIAEYFYGDTAASRESVKFYVDQGLSVIPGQVPLGGTTRVEFSNKHLGYAMTWYGLAIGLVGVYISFMRQQKKLNVPSG